MVKLFYTSWKNKTPLEKKYISALENALIFMKEQSFIKEIISIYVKGSFVFREINKKSDIDLVVVMRDEKSLKSIGRFRDNYKEMLWPVDLLPLALEELENNARFIQRSDKPRPDHFTLLLQYHRLVYGKQLKTKCWKVRADKKVYDNLKSAIKNTQVPLFEKGEFDFQQIIKQVMHLIWWEERLKGHYFPSSWKEIQKACPKNYLLQKTVYLRYHPTKDEKIRNKYILELKEYLTK